MVLICPVPSLQIEWSSLIACILDVGMPASLFPTLPKVCFVQEVFVHFPHSACMQPVHCPHCVPSLPVLIEVQRSRVINQKRLTFIVCMFGCNTWTYIWFEKWYSIGNRIVTNTIAKATCLYSLLACSDAYVTYARKPSLSLDFPLGTHAACVPLCKAL